MSGSRRNLDAYLDRKARARKHAEQGFPVGRTTGAHEVRARVVDRGLPRVHMMLLLAGAGAVGFLSSVVMLRGGLDVMAVRYPLAVLAGYGAFLGGVRLWLWGAVRRLAKRTAGREARRAEDAGGRANADLPDLLDLDASVVRHGLDALRGAAEGAGSGFGGGGGFAGGGGGATWGSASDAASAGARAAGSAAKGGAKSGGGIDLDLDDGAVALMPVVAGLAVLCAALASAYVVWTAPAFFAELLLDGLVAAGVYRRLRASDARHWLLGAMRRTVLPALGLAAVLGAAGWFVQGTVPGADSVGDVWRWWRATRGGGP